MATIREIREVLELAQRTTRARELDRVVDRFPVLRLRDLSTGGEKAQAIREILEVFFRFLQKDGAQSRRFAARALERLYDSESGDALSEFYPRIRLLQLEESDGAVSERLLHVLANDDAFQAESVEQAILYIVCALRIPRATKSWKARAAVASRLHMLLTLTPKQAASEATFHDTLRGMREELRALWKQCLLHLQVVNLGRCQSDFIPDDEQQLTWKFASLVDERLAKILG